MKNPNIKTKIVHSQTKAAWNIVGTTPGGKFKIARIPYNTKCPSNIEEIERTEALEHASFISECFNKSLEIIKFLHPDDQKNDQKPPIETCIINPLEDTNILSPEIAKAIDKILKKCPDAVFGGSIALNALGLINRKISDIDLFFPINTSIARIGFTSMADGEILSDTVTNVNGKKIQRTGIKIGDVKACAFCVSAEELQYSYFFFNGRKIKIQNVNYAILAKKYYEANSGNPKHGVDLKNIEQALSSLLNEDDLPF